MGHSSQSRIVLSTFSKLELKAYSQNPHSRSSAPGTKKAGRSLLDWHAQSRARAAIRTQSSRGERSYIVTLKM